MYLYTEKQYSRDLTKRWGVIELRELQDGLNEWSSKPGGFLPDPVFIPD